ncbi:class I SAM-dependent methyltransferase [Catenovulum sp. 2E275]|uniref:class I SAM-dependent methyltransferase n=1 Tax=Catenovulum sp. 2E275 TaxID=2980497 RepID=UPI0021CEF1CE|nr:class I SAM-dependent methyltransferase [Catenovulum sp. 2E275]MCU4675127.1 class I SAM-dependent methyltransferase [Catenovulum sp. 2E275]
MIPALSIRAAKTEIDNNLNLQQLAQLFQFKLTENIEYPLQLVWENNQLCLFQTEVKNQGGILVDLCSSQSDYRRNQASIKKEVIARAVGIKPNYRPSVLDATAGLGRDGFVLAALGCQVTWLERNSAVAALLYDGLARAKQDSEIGGWVAQRLKLIYGSALDEQNILASLAADKPDVVYLDPMYPHKKKSAAVKKEMKVFQSLVGADLDSDGLLVSAKKIALKRIVVKRPDYAEPLNNEKPDFTVDSKKHRFDIYLVNV